jgi:hypothetical protein
VTWCAIAATARRSRTRFEFWFHTGYGMRIDTLTSVLLNFLEVQGVTI